MNINRRNFIRSSAGAAAFVAAAPKAVAEALSPSQLGAFARQFGVPSPGTGITARNLETLRTFQEFRPTAPPSIQDYTPFLNNLPIVKAMRTANGLSPELFHLILWHEFLLILNAYDHTTLANSAAPAYGEQFGPHRSSWAFAIFHLAVF